MMLGICFEILPKKKKMENIEQILQNLIVQSLWCVCVFTLFSSLYVRNAHKKFKFVERINESPD